MKAQRERDRLFRLGKSLPPRLLNLHKIKGDGSQQRVYQECMVLKTEGEDQATWNPVALVMAKAEQLWTEV